MLQHTESKPETVTNPEFGQLNQDTRATKGKTQVGETRSRRVEIEEIEDEYWINEAKMPKAIRGIIEDAEEEEIGVPMEEEA
jgi:hypothetical protein